MSFRVDHSEPMMPKRLHWQLREGLWAVSGATVGRVTSFHIRLKHSRRQEVSLLSSIFLRRRLRQSVGADLGEEVFIKWLARQANPKAKANPIAVKIVEALRGLETDPKFRLGNYGYTILNRPGFPGDRFS